jgi:hypothetical protein
MSVGFERPLPAIRHWSPSKNATGFRLGGSSATAEISPYCRRSTASRYRRPRLLTKMAHTHADIPFKPPLENVDLLDGQACDQAIETCYRYEVEKLDQLGRPITSCICVIGTRMTRNYFADKLH